MNIKTNLFLIVCLISLFSTPALGAASSPPTNLTQHDASMTSITWNWTSNYPNYNTSVYIDSVWFANVTSPTNGTQETTKTGLTKGSIHYIGLRSYNATSEYSTWTNGTGVTDGSLTGVWEFITEITDNQSSIISVIILVVVLLVVRKFGNGIVNMLHIGGK